MSQQKNNGRSKLNVMKLILCSWGNRLYCKQGFFNTTFYCGWQIRRFVNKNVKLLPGCVRERILLPLLL